MIGLTSYGSVAGFNDYPGRICSVAHSSGARFNDEVSLSHRNDGASRIGWRTMSDRSTVITVSEITDAVAPIAARCGIAKVSLFGSYARGEARPASDVDLLVELGDESRPIAVYSFAEKVRCALNKDVDVFELRELEEGPFRDAVMRDLTEVA